MKKLKKQGGFTLVEMLIVVAIIAILIAISIPLVNNALERARHATDDANFRAAAGLGTIEYLSNNLTGDYYYFTNKASQGGLYATKSAATTADSGNEAYKSQCSIDSCSVDTKTETSKGKYIKVSIDGDGKVEVEWTGTAPSDS